MPVVIMESLQPDGTASVFTSTDGQAWTETPVTGMDGATVLLAPSPDGGVAVAGYARLEETTDDFGTYLAFLDPTAWVGPSPAAAAPSDA